MGTTIDTTLIVLTDHMWPGVPDARQGEPKDGFAGSDHHNVLVPIFPVGTKIQVYNSGATYGVAGPSILAYLRVGTQATGGDIIAAKSLCTPEDATWTYQVSNDGSAGNSVNDVAAAVALSAMTDAYYGWFWVGGVCPSDVYGLSALDGTMTTDDSVAAKNGIIADGSDPNVLGILLNSTVNNGFGYAIAGD